MLGTSWVLSSSGILDIFFYIHQQICQCFDDDINQNSIMEKHLNYNFEGFGLSIINFILEPSK